VDQLEVVDSVVEKIAVNMGFSDDARADLGICVTEAVMNAITHAHHERSDLFVDVNIQSFFDRLTVSVRDYGNGFELVELPDPTTPEHLMDDHGRGMLIIRSMMDEVHVERLDEGMRITMTKLLRKPE
jgi:serine/threonine-protein kinase RsbW